MIGAHAERACAAASPTGKPITQVCVPNTGTHHRGSVAPTGGAARMLGKRHRLRNVIAGSSRAGPALPPALRQGACRGPGLQMGSSRSILVRSSYQAARRPSPVSQRSPL